MHPVLLPFAFATIQLITSQKNIDEAIEYIYRLNEKGDKAINYVLRKYEDKNKLKAIETSIKTNRDKGVYFYVSSKHFDSAKDHEAYQGKLYVDEKHPPELNEFIAKNKIDTIQYIMGPPVYFITRPHCRHFFRALKTDTVLKGKYKVPTRKKGDKKFQTPSGKTDEAKVQAYRERLEILEGIYKYKKTPKLRDMILKTKLLIKKWEEYRLQTV